MSGREVLWESGSWCFPMSGLIRSLGFAGVVFWFAPYAPGCERSGESSSRASGRDSAPVSRVERNRAERSLRAPDSGRGVTAANRQDDTDATGTVVARWNPSPGVEGRFGQIDTLVYGSESGEMVLLSRFGDGTRLREVLTERPASGEGKRRFDFTPEGETEWFTLSEVGEIRFFDEFGRSEVMVQATFLHVEAMEIGKNIQPSTCVPKELSGPSREMARLYRELESFRGDRAFAAVGFDVYGPYIGWLERAEDLVARTDGDYSTLRDLGLFASDLVSLGIDYVIDPKVRDRDTRRARAAFENALAVAECREIE